MFQHGIEKKRAQDISLSHPTLDGKIFGARHCASLILVRTCKRINSVWWLASLVVCRYGAAPFLITSCRPTEPINTGLFIDGFALRFSRDMCRNPYSISAMNPSMASRTAVPGTMSFNHVNSKLSDMVAVGTSFPFTLVMTRNDL